MSNCLRTLVVMVLVGIFSIEFVVKFDNIGISSVPTKGVAGSVKAENMFPRDRLAFFNGHGGVGVGVGVGVRHGRQSRLLERIQRGKDGENRRQNKVNWLRETNRQTAANGRGA